MILAGPFHIHLKELERADFAIAGHIGWYWQGLRAALEQSRGNRLGPGITLEYPRQIQLRPIGARGQRQNQGDTERKDH